MVNSRSGVSFLAILATTGLAVSVASAQPPSSDPLRGPDVRDRQVPGVDGSFGDPAGDQKRLVNENRLPPRVFRNAMQVILDPNAPENIRVTDEQRTRYQGWLDDFQKTVTDYMKQHRQELAELRGKGGDPGQFRRRGGPNDAPPAPPQDDSMKPDAPKPEDPANARARFQEIMSGAPKVEDLYTKIWAELNPEQQKAVDAKIAEFRVEEAKRREDRYVAQRAGKRKGGAGDAPRPNAKPDAAPGFPDARADNPEARRPLPIDPDRRDRLLRMFAQLTPEQQDRVLERLEQFRAGAPGGQPPRRGRIGADGPGEAKPAPQPDDSMMPPPPPPPPPQSPPSPPEPAGPPRNQP